MNYSTVVKDEIVLSCISIDCVNIFKNKKTLICNSYSGRSPALAS